MRLGLGRTVAVVVVLFAAGTTACRPPPGSVPPPPTSPPTTSPPTTPPHFTAGWPQRLADPAHSSHTTDSTTTRSNLASYAERWHLQMPRCAGASYAGGGLVSSPVIFNGVIFAGANNGCLLAINEADGTVKWSRFFAWQPKLTCNNRPAIVPPSTTCGLLE